LQQTALPHPNSRSNDGGPLQPRPEKDSRDRAGFEAANREFHLLPCRIAGFTRAEQTLHSLLTEWERLHRIAFQRTQPPDMETANQDHQAIVSAFREKDAVQLGSLLARHNQTAADHYRRFVRVEE
jgi:DNA-binding GntR family transcriptional regulator